MKSVTPPHPSSKWACATLFMYYLISLKSMAITAALEFDPGNDNCRRSISINSNPHANNTYEIKSCFNVKVNYTSTSELVDPTKSQHQLLNELSKWEVFKRSPKCWTVLQPLLCATFMPKVNNDSLIELPSQELCKVARSHCRTIVEYVMNGWPDFLRCENTVNYRPNCKSAEIRGMNFTAGECMDPMIAVNDSFSYYEGFEGCGLKCQDPMFTTEEHSSMSKTILCLSLFLFIVSTIIICTFFLDWKSSSGLPPEIIFYVILCYAVGNLGWMLQFWPNAKSDIVCRHDGTIQRNELDQKLFCLTEFSLVYFGSVTAMGWLAVFAFVWNLTCNAAGVIRSRVENQAAYFHCLIWILSAFLTILSISLGKVDGNSMSGVCFISYKNPIARIGLVVVPILMTSTVAFFYFTKGLYRLYVVQKSSDLIPHSGRKYLRSMFRRAFVFLVLAIVIMLAFLATEVYQMLMWPYWSRSLRDFLICKMKLRTEVDSDDCRMMYRPSTWLTGINIVLFFCGGFLLCSWACTADTIDIWKRKLPRFFGNPNVKTNSHRRRVQKHHLVAQAYEKKKRLNIPRNASLSLTLQSIHGDPIGLNRLLDPVQLCQESNSRMNQTDDGDDISSDWVRALPNMLERRNALTIPGLESCNNSGSEDRPPSTGRRPHDSNSDLDKNKRRSRLSKLKEKLGSKKGRRRGSITSFESSDINSKQYQSSNSELDKPKSKSGLTTTQGKSGIRNGFGWRGRFGSMSSLESNGIAVTLPSINKKKKSPTKRILLVKELGIQTSLELLPFAQPVSLQRRIDKGMQTSNQSLHQKDFGTQTRKSATKKHKKRHPEHEKYQDGNDETEMATNGHENDHITKLLSPDPGNANSLPGKISKNEKSLNST